MNNSMTKSPAIESKSIKWHSMLALYYKCKPLFFTNEYKKNPNKRKCFELAFQLTKAEKWTELNDTLTSLLFIDAKVRAGLLEDLFRDFAEALQQVPDTLYRESVNKIRYYLLLKWHILQQNQEVCFQVLFNEIQWENTRLGEKVENCCKLYLSAGNKLLHQYRIPHKGGKLITTIDSFERFQTIQGCSISRDNTKILTWGSKFIKVFDLQPPKQLVSVNDHNKAGENFRYRNISKAALSPDGEKFASLDPEGTIKIRELNTGMLLSSFRGGGKNQNYMDYYWSDSKNDRYLGYRDFSWSPDGKKIAASRYFDLVIIDIGTDSEIIKLAGHKGKVDSCDWASDGTRIVTAAQDHVVKLWDTESGLELKTIHRKSGPFVRCSFSADSSKIIVRDVESVNIYNPLTGIEIISLNRDTQKRGALVFVPSAFSRNGEKAAFYFPGGPKIWDLIEDKEIATLTNHSDRVRAIAWSYDNTKLLSGGEDAVLNVWDLNSVVTPFSLREKSKIETCTATPDGRRAFSFYDNSPPKAWDTKTGEPHGELPVKKVSAQCSDLSADSRYLVYGSGKKLSVLNARTGNTVKLISGFDSYVRSCGLSPDGSRLLTAHENGIRYVWDSFSGKKIKSVDSDPAYVDHCQFSLDGKIFAFTTGHTGIDLWQTAPDKKLMSFATNMNTIYSFAFSPDNKCIITDRDCSIFNIHSGKRKNIPNAHIKTAPHIWSPDGKKVICIDNDIHLKIKDLKSGKELLTHELHSDVINKFHWLPDGKFIITTSWDKTLRVWDVDTGECLSVFHLSNRCNGLSISGNGEKIICSDQGSSLYFLKPKGYRQGPLIVTSIRFWNHQSNEWAKQPVVKCPNCLLSFEADKKILDTVFSINRQCNIDPCDSPCFSLPRDAWEEPGLVSECPKCHKPLKFNPFVVDNRGIYE